MDLKFLTLKEKCMQTFASFLQELFFSMQKSIEGHLFPNSQRRFQMTRLPKEWHKDGIINGLRKQKFSSLEIALAKSIFVRPLNMYCLVNKALKSPLNNFYGLLSDKEPKT